VRAATAGLAAEEAACATARRAVSLVLDDEAGAADALAVAWHIQRCDHCRRFAREVSGFTRALRSLGAEPRRSREAAGRQ
jgi:predicted anti-sigma-YlaC factor YlaD